MLFLSWMTEELTMEEKARLEEDPEKFDWTDP
jgi:hypothetical protein